jgi:hypothetical protein
MLYMAVCYSIFVCVCVCVYDCMTARMHQLSQINFPFLNSLQHIQIQIAKHISQELKKYRCKNVLNENVCFTIHTTFLYALSLIYSINVRNGVFLLHAHFSFMVQREYTFVESFALAIIVPSITHIQNPVICIWEKVFRDALKQIINKKLWMYMWWQSLLVWNFHSYGEINVPCSM